jgi:hypothetical protein
VTEILRGVVAALADARLPLVGVALALHLAGLVITGERWRVVIVALGPRLRLARTTLINLAGIFVRNATPTTGLGGDASRIALLCAEGVPLPRATASFAWVRLAEFPPIALLVALSMPVAVAGVRHVSDPRLTPRVIAAAMAVAGAVLWIKRKALHTRVADLWQRTRPVHISRRAIALAVFYATFAQIETIARQIVVAAAFGLPLTIPQAATVTVMGIVGGFAPTVGGIGAIDGSLVAGLILCGATTETAIAITLVERAISYGVGTALGAAALAWLGGRGVLRTVNARRTNMAAAG